MIRTALLIAATCVVLPQGCSGSKDGAKSEAPVHAAWLTSWDEAVAESKKTGKPILVDFTGKDPTGEYWCGPCKEMRLRIFDTKVFKEWSDEHVVLLEVEIPNPQNRSVEPTAQNKQLMEKYEVFGLPTVLFLKADGSKIGTGHFSGETASEWIGNYERLAKKTVAEKPAP